MEPFEIESDPSRRDTICAISTPPGTGGIAIARVSGPDAISIVDSLWKGRRLTDAQSHTAHLGVICSSDGNPLDQGVATIFRAPRSFTGDDTVEISVHGSRFVQRELLNTLISAGTRLAQPGEFTRRAFISGKMDLAEAEAVADVIASNSRAAHRLAMNQMRGGFSRRLSQLREKLLELASLLELELDFSEEEVEFASRDKLLEIAESVNTEVNRLRHSFTNGQAIKDGIPVAIIGATNAGKSSLLNALLGDDRAIVSEIHGTTRDTIEETIEIGDYTFRFIDTAGLRNTTDTIEQIGIQRSRNAIATARIIIAVTDATLPIDLDIVQSATSPLRQEPKGHLILALNKTDLGTVDSDTIKDATSFVSGLPQDHATAISISAKTGEGLDTLRARLIHAAQIENGNADEDILVTNARHAQALENAFHSSQRVISGLRQDLPGDLIAQDLRETIHHLSAITGAVTTPDILATIFSRFCIGK